MRPSIKRADGDKPSSAADPLTSAGADATRFSISQPKGYYFPQVDKFVASTIAALRSWEEYGIEASQRIAEQDQTIALQAQQIEALTASTSVDVAAERDAAVAAAQALRLEVESLRAAAAVQAAAPVSPPEPTVVMPSWPAEAPTALETPEAQAFQVHAGNEPPAPEAFAPVADAAPAPAPSAVRAIPSRRLAARPISAPPQVAPPLAEPATARAGHSPGFEPEVAAEPARGVFSLEGGSEHDADPLAFLRH